MPHIKGVVGRFLSLGKATDPAAGSESRESISSTGQDLVSIRLMPNIPDDSVRRGIENPVQGNGKFHHAKTWRQVPPIGGAGVYDQFPDLRCKAVQFRSGKPLQFIRAGNEVE